MKKLRIIPLGGMGNVTRNLFVYEYDDELLIVDCGIGFPERYMLGVDILIPDVSYIAKRVQEGAKIVGMCLTHAHDDHIAALPYALQMIGYDFPIFGSPLTAAFAESRMEDGGIEKDVSVYPEKKPLKLGTYFSIETVRVTHSVPDTRHLVISTPEGVVYHGSDFKFDMNPVDGIRSDFNKIAAVGSAGILCALVDCLRVEREIWSKPEKSVMETLIKSIHSCEGKFVLTLMGSNIHRIQLAIDVAMEYRRKVVFIGRSIEQNVKIAQELGLLRIPKGVVIYKKNMDQYPDHELCVIIAGSQGQPGSSLVRVVGGEHPLMALTKKDRVVFSSEPIPGNETYVYDTIDELSANGIDVVYSDIEGGLHVSGHAGLVEQQLLISMLKPKYLLPIGGTERHRVQFSRMSGDLGFRKNQVLVPENGQVIEFVDGAASIGETISLKDLMVDGLGVGDVGNILLSDRRIMAEEGMVAVVVPKSSRGWELDKIVVDTRGFVFMKEAQEMIEGIKEESADVVRTNPNLPEHELRKLIEKRLTKRFDRIIGRTPLVVSVFLPA